MKLNQKKAYHSEITLFITRYLIHNYKFISQKWTFFLAHQQARLFSVTIADFGSVTGIDQTTYTIWQLYSSKQSSST